MPKICPVCGESFGDASVFCPTDGASLRAESSDGDLVGSVIAERYLVTELLGQGGMGTVYVARHVRLPLQAAIKVLRPEMLQDPSAIARFNREAANASRIEHERVARVFDFGETRDGMVYLAMEYIPGVELKALLRDGPLSLDRTVGIIRQVADGLDAAHKLGIIHRDLKPDNIMVVPDDEGRDRCKILDFGIAKAVSGTDSGAGLTKTGFVVGTPEFMSPEQLLGEAVDARSDVYSLALVAYQCLTGDLPFDSRTPDRGMTARLFAEPRQLREVRAEGSWSTAVQAVFDQTLQRDPDPRPASAGAFARLLGEAARTAEPPTGASPPPSAVTGSVAGATRAAQTAPAPAIHATGRRAAIPAVAAAVLVLGAIGGWYALRGRDGAAAVDTQVSPATATVESAGVPGEAPAATIVPDSARSETDGPDIARPSGSVAVQPSAPRGASPDGAATSASGGKSNAPPGELSAVARAARTTLDSVTRLIDPESPNPTNAREALLILRATLPRLGTAADSTWAYIRSAEAHLILEQEEPACQALRTARRTASTMDQTRAINNYVGLLGCSQ